MTYLCGIVSMGPDAGYCGFTPGGYTMTNIPCVFLFLKTRGQKFRGREREPYGIKAERGYLVKIFFVCNYLVSQWILHI